MADELGPQIEYEILICPNPKCGAKNAIRLKDKGKAHKCRKCGVPFTSQEAVVAGSRDTLKASQRSPNLTGRQLGHFKLMGVLGTGAMGVVYRAQDTMLMREVAVKVLPREMCESDPKGLERFLNEARTAAQLVHPNVVQIFHIAQSEGNYFIAMEYVRGGTIERAARLQGGKLDELFGMEKMLETAEALALGHRRRIYHRDIKPANLLLTTEGMIKVADFGLALWRENSVEDVTPKSTIVGTPQYLSPEQVGGQPGDAASDVYSLGATYFRLFTGEIPYKARNAIGYFQQHVSAPVPNPLDMVPTLNPDLAGLLMRCLAKKPEDRPSALQISGFLRERLGGRSGAMALPPGSGDSSTSLMPSVTDRSKVADSSLHDTHTFSSQSTYLNRYGLSFYPFNDVRNPNLFWNAGPYKQALESVITQIHLGVSPIVMSGPSGSGRSFIAAMVQKSLGEETTILLVQPRLLGGARLMSSLCKLAGQEVEDESSSERILRHFGRSVCAGQPEQKILVILDEIKASDAGLLAEIRQLIHLGGEYTNLSLLLVGLPNLPETLESGGIPLDLRGSSEAILVRGMNEEEMLGYLDFRMQVVGRSTSKFPLTPAAKTLLHRHTGGVPRLVNIYCHNALTLGASLKQDTVNVELLWRAMQKKSYATNVESLPRMGERPVDVWRRMDLLRAMDLVVN